MSVIVLLITAGGIVTTGFMAAFIWAVRSGQFDDTHTPAVRMLMESEQPAHNRAIRPSRQHYSLRLGPHPQTPALADARDLVSRQSAVSIGDSVGPHAQTPALADAREIVSRHRANG